MFAATLAPWFARRGIHYGWVMVALTFVTAVCSSAALSMPGVLVLSIEREFGWSRGQVSVAMALLLVLFGGTAPFAGALMLRYGLRKVVLPGGGLNATMAGLTAASSPFDPMTVFSDRYRCITMDLRNATGGQSSGPVEAERPWDAYADDQIGLMDHLGIDRFGVMGFCIGGPFIWNLLKRAGARIPAAVIVQPSGHRPEMPDQFYNNNMANWGPALCARRPDVSMAQVEAFLSRMYRANQDFVFTVTRDFVRLCQTPIMVLPDDVPPHPYAVAMESALLAPNAQVSLYPWKQPKEHIPLAVRHIGTFLKAHCS